MAPMIEYPTPCVTISARANHQVLAISAGFREMVGRAHDEGDEQFTCGDLLCCGEAEGSCQVEDCPLVRVYRCEDKYLEDVPVRLRLNGDLVPTRAHFFALWEPWESYVSVWFGAADAYE